MAGTARRDGTPGKKRGSKASLQGKKGPAVTPRTKKPHRGQGAKPKATDIIISKAKPARHQRVSAEHAQQLRQQNNLRSEDGIRLQKVLAAAGVASRRQAEELIDQGRVEVNGQIVLTQGLRIDPATAVVRVDGVRVSINEEMMYFVLNKPRGLQSTMHDELGRPCVGDIVGEKLDAGQRLFHVGRLDAQTEGLLLLTNDGELANRLMHPKYEITKTYLATVLGEADRTLVKQLKQGIELDDGPAKADYVQIVDVHNGKSLIRVELHEGRKHIVRRMLKAAGFPVERLVRTKIHTVQLGEQTPGALRALNQAELASLFKAVGM